MSPAGGAPDRDRAVAGGVEQRPQRGHRMHGAVGGAVLDEDAAGVVFPQLT